LWTGIWRLAFRPVAQYFYDRKLRKVGWEGMYREDMERQRGINRFPDLEEEI
jgi:hypothetical protein